MLVTISGDCILCCPRCGGDNLHHGSVQVFNRRQEDGPSSAVLIPIREGPRVGAPSDNPSARRNGLLINFFCETCGEAPAEDLTLEVIQHKGNTFVRWRL